MIVCPNCKHENPEGATSCEACYTALPATKACPTCGASVQLDATFCGQCGQNLSSADPKIPISPPVVAAGESTGSGLPPTVLTGKETTSPPVATPPVVAEVPPLPEPVAEVPEIETPAPPIASTVPPTVAAIPEPPTSEPEVEPSAPPIPEPSVPPIPAPAALVSTQIQSTAYSLLHLQTNTTIEIPLHLSVIHIGKPNEQSPPDIDVSGFPSAEVVSRIHANLRIEGQGYYIEDVGSANGTYINHNVLAKGNRHLLRPGDRIGLGKGDLVTFIFQ
jgi:ribosomal protein L40E